MSGRAALAYLEPEQVGAILEVASASGRTGVRNAAAISLMYHGGLRVGELCYLRADAVDAERLTVTVPPEGKTGGRVCELPLDSLPFLMAWERLRPRYAARNTECDRYLLNKSGRPCDRHNLYREIRRYADGLGIEGVHPHTFRHSHAMRVLENPSAEITDVQAMLGHKSLASTMVYLHADTRRKRMVADTTRW